MTPVAVASGLMGAVLLATTDAFLAHETGSWHPERPARLTAAIRSIERAGLSEVITTFRPRAATREELELVHPKVFLDALHNFCTTGGGMIDDDTVAVPASWDALTLAAGAGLECVERLERGEANAGFCIVRPPGHHATQRRSMGFCLINNVAVTAAALADRGEKVLIVDYDAHHGNGTQDIFWNDSRVAYVSMHQFPHYPGSGRLHDSGGPDALGTTVNFPFPAGTTGDAYLASVDEVIAPLASAFGATWLLLSAGYDAHRNDPLCQLGLTAHDFGDLTERLAGLFPPGRTLAFMEGGYDLDALGISVASSVAALAGEPYRAERVSVGDRGRTVVEAVRKHQHKMTEQAARVTEGRDVDLLSAPASAVSSGWNAEPA